MAKAGMRRPDPYDPKNHGTENHQNMHHPENKQAQVPEIQGAPNWAREDYKTGN